jgi:hypothetical protein
MIYECPQCGDVFQTDVPAPVCDNCGGPMRETVGDFDPETGALWHVWRTTPTITPSQHSALQDNFLREVVLDNIASALLAGGAPAWMNSELVENIADEIVRGYSYGAPSVATPEWLRDTVTDAHQAAAVLNGMRGGGNMARAVLRLCALATEDSPLDPPKTQRATDRAMAIPEVLARGWYHWNEEEQDYDLYANRDAACENCIGVLIVRDPSAITPPAEAREPDGGA